MFRVETIPLILGVIVFIHEYGHYVLMVRNGVKVEEFTVGFGPTLFERKLASGTMFRIKLLLAGGYAKPVQSGEGSMDGCSSWAKFKIYMAGMFFNSCAALSKPSVDDIETPVRFSTSSSLGVAAVKPVKSVSRKRESTKTGIPARLRINSAARASTTP